MTQIPLKGAEGRHGGLCFFVLVVCFEKERKCVIVDFVFGGSKRQFDDVERSRSSLLWDCFELRM